MTTKKVNIISAEQDDFFDTFDVDKIIIDQPKVGPKGVWINIKYQYENGSIGKLKIQTPEMFSYGISKYEESSIPRFTFLMTNRSQRESLLAGKPLPASEMLDVQLEDATIKILDDINEKIKEEMRKPEMTQALKKYKKSIHKDEINKMEIIKKREAQNAKFENHYLYAKVVPNTFMKTKFFVMNKDLEVEEVDAEEIVPRLMQSETNNTHCRATAMIAIDSIFVNTQAHIQVKVMEVMISEIIESKKEMAIQVSGRMKKKMEEKALQQAKESRSTRNVQINKILRKEESSDSDSDIDG